MPIKVKIPVKIGSHLTSVCLNDKMNCNDFIRVALIQCNLIKAANEYLSTYALFERLNGIELMIETGSNISCLWTTKWSALINNQNFALIIKKYKKSENLCKFIEKNEKRMHHLFEISRQLSMQNINSDDEKLSIMKINKTIVVQDKSTSGDSFTTKMSGSSGANLLKKNNAKLSGKNKFFKKLFFKSEAKSLLRNISNSSFLQLSKSKNTPAKLENSVSHLYEEIDNNIIL